MERVKRVKSALIFTMTKAVYDQLCSRITTLQKGIYEIFINPFLNSTCIKNISITLYNQYT